MGNKSIKILQHFISSLLFLISSFSSQADENGTLLCKFSYEQNMAAITKEKVKQCLDQVPVDNIDHVDIFGFSSEIGDVDYNTQLSQARAINIYEVLKAEGKIRKIKPTSCGTNDQIGQSAVLVIYKKNANTAAADSGLTCKALETRLADKPKPENSQSNSKAEDAKYVAEVHQSVGEVDIINSAGKTPAADGMKIQIGDFIDAKNHGFIKIQFFDGSYILLFENSSMHVQSYSSDSEVTPQAEEGVFDRIVGKLKFFLKKAPSTAKNFQYMTSNAVMGIRGTSGYIMTSKDGKETNVIVLSGVVRVSNRKNPNHFVYIKKEEFTIVKNNTSPTPPAPVTAKMIASAKAGQPPEDAVLEKIEPINQKEKPAADLAKVENKSKGLSNVWLFTDIFITVLILLVILYLYIK